MPPHPDHLNGLLAGQLLYVEAMKLQKKMAVGQNLPSLAIGAGYNYHNLLDNNRSFAMAFATLSVPISDWWGRLACHKAEKDRTAESRGTIARRQRTASHQDAKALQRCYGGTAAVTTCLESIEQAEENLRLHRDYYRAGTATMSNLLEAQLLYQQTLDRRTDAYAELQNKLLEYRQATGQ